MLTKAAGSHTMSCSSRLKTESLRSAPQALPPLPEETSDFPIQGTNALLEKATQELEEERRKVEELLQARQNAEGKLADLQRTTRASLHDVTSRWQESERLRRDAAQRLSTQTLKRWQERLMQVAEQFWTEAEQETVRLEQELARARQSTNSGRDLTRIGGLLAAPQDEQLQSEVTRQRTEIDRLQARIRALETFEAQALQYGAESRRLLAENRQLHDRIGQLEPCEAQVASLSEEVAQCKLENSRLRARVDDHGQEAEVQRLQDEVAAQKLRADNLQQKVSQLQLHESEVSKMGETLSSHKQVIDSLKRRVAQLEPHEAEAARLRSVMLKGLSYKPGGLVPPSQVPAHSIAISAVPATPLSSARSICVSRGLDDAVVSPLSGTGPVVALDGEVNLRISGGWNMMKHVKSGRGGLVELQDAPRLCMRLQDTAGELLQRINVEKNWVPQVSQAIFSAWGEREDGSVRLKLPWRAVSSVDDPTPLSTWLEEWLSEARVGPDGLPHVNLWVYGLLANTSWKWIFLKAYNPRFGRLEYDWCWFTDDEDTSRMKQWLRRQADVADRPQCDIQLWREDGPNTSPTWTELKLNWEAQAWSELGLGHGDLLVVQEHPTWLPQGLHHPATGPEWLKRKVFHHSRSSSGSTK